MDTTPGGRTRMMMMSVIMRGWVGVKFPRKKHYATLEWLADDIIHKLPG